MRFESVNRCPVPGVFLFFFRKQFDLCEQEYMHLDIADRHECPLAWWKAHEKCCLVGTNLAMLARHCFSIPGSSAMLERAFSHAGRAIGPKRAVLTMKHSEAIIFVHENILRKNIDA